LLLTSGALPLGRPKPDLARALERLDHRARLRGGSGANGAAGAAGVGGGAPGYARRAVRPLFDTPALERVLRPALGDVGLLLHGLVARLGLRGLPLVGRLAGGGDLGRQLALVWPGVSPAQFAGLKVLWGAVGTVAVVASAQAAATLADGASPAAWPAWAWPLVFGVPFLVPDVELARRLAQRREAVLRELPTALELLTLATTAGEGLEQALQLVATRAEGVVAGALRATLQDAAVGGRPLGAALEAVAAREGVEELATVAGHLRAVQEQGLPLASSLAALADGVRERKRVRLQAAGGRATVRMLVPIAVLILPVLAVVLIYPALAEIWESLG
jgi:tight adherence protein C